MSKLSILWRAVLGMENALPWREFVVSPREAPRDRRPGWKVVVLLSWAWMIPMVGVPLMRMSRADFAALWSVLQTAAVQLGVVVAGVGLLAVIAAASVMRWRDRTRHA